MRKLLLIFMIASVGICQSWCGQPSWDGAGNWTGQARVLAEDETVAQWTPLSETSCNLWLSPDDNATVLDGGGLQSGDGDVVATWNDQTTGSNDAAQTTNNLRPLYSIADTSSIDPDGIDDYMKVSSYQVVSADSSEMSAVVWYLNDFSPLVTQYLTSKWNTGAAADRSFGFVIRPYVGADTLGVLISCDGSFDAAEIKEYRFEIPDDDSLWHSVGFTFDTGTLKIYYDGVEVTPVKAVDGAISTIHNGSSSLTIGCFLNNGTPASFYEGLIGTVATFNAALSAESMGKLHTEYPFGE